MIRICFLAILLPLQAMAQPKVVADIPPVAGLVAQIMRGVGTPDLLIPAGASPHHYSFRPSDARAVAEADVIFWVGPDLSPQISRALLGRTDRGLVHTFLEAETTYRLGYRDADGVQDEHRHDSHGHDPHAWLSPKNAVIWLEQIADVLAALDEENAATYRANAVSGRTAIEAALAPQVQPLSYVAGHDAYQYIEESFGLSFQGAVTSSDAEQPSPAQVLEVGLAIAKDRVHCIIVETNSDKDRLSKRFGTEAAAYALIDPMGFGITVDADFYPKFMRNIVDALEPCRDLAE